MKETIIFWLIAILGLAGVASGAEVIDNDRIYLSCNNATDGSLLGAAATLKCWDADGNVDVNDEALTNVETGVFYYVLHETDDRYWCRVNCPSGAVDYVIPAWQRTLPLIDSDNIGLDLDDTSGTLDAAEIGAGAITADKIASNAFTAAKFAADFWTSLQDYVWNETTRLLTGFTASWIDSETISESEMNTSHGVGLYNATGSGGGASVDEIWQREIDDPRNKTAEQMLNETWNAQFVSGWF